MLGRTVACAFLGVLVACCALAVPARAGLIVEVPTDLAFEAVDQSVWGGGSAIRDSGLKFAGKRWPATGNKAVAKSLSVKRSALPSVNASFAFGSTGELGVDFRATFNAGSVTADYRSVGTIAVAEADPPGEGVRHFTIQTAEPVDPRAHMGTEAPGIDIESNFIARMNATAQAAGKVVFQPARRVCVPLVGCTTIPEVGASGALPKTEVVDFDIEKELFSLTNEDIRILGNSIKDKNPTFREESGEDQLAITLDLQFDPVEFATATGLGIDVRVTDESNPKMPRKSKSVDPKDIVSLGFSAGDLTLYAPVLDTETSDFTTEDGRKVLKTTGDTKLAKVDVDLDFMATILAANVGAAIPLGLTAELGVGPVKFTAEADIMDADMGTVLFGTQDFTFAPELNVTLDFGQTVQFREIGAEAWSFGRKATGKVGTEFEVLYDGTGDLVVTPTYTLANEFTNVTSLSLGQQLAIDILKFSLSAPFNIPLVGPVQVAQFLEESATRLPLGSVFDKTFALDFGGVEGQAVSLGGIPLDLGLGGAFAAELVTGSPASLIQQVATPEGPFDLVFDYLFETVTGELTVLLGGLELGTISAPGTLASDFLTATFSILDPSLFDQDAIALTFLFDGPGGARLLLDDIAFFDASGQRHAIGNGDFQAGNLGGWVGLSSGEGSARVRNLNAAAIPTVAEPGSLALVAVGLAAAWSARRRRAAA